MTQITPATPSLLAAYRSNHRIQVEPTDHPFVWRCRHDGIRVHEGRRSWRHDTVELAALIRAEFGGKWPGREGAIDAVAAAVASDIAREDAFANGRIVVDDVTR